MPRFLAALACLLIMSLTTPANAAERVALVIGFDRYEHIFELKNAASDAAAVKDKLASLGFEVTTLFDAGKKALEDAIDQLAQNAKDAELVAIYFAGHAVQLGGSNYILPIDARMDRPTDVAEFAVGLQKLVEAASAAENTLVMFDAARNNPFAGQDIPDLEAQGDKSSSSLAILFATAPGSIVLDGEEGGHSPFTTALLEHLGKPGEDIQTASSAIRLAVADATGGDQIPWSSFSGDSPMILAE